jgi:hypothetical protein
MADAHGLGPCAARRESSSLSFRTRPLRETERPGTPTTLANLQPRLLFCSTIHVRSSLTCAVRLSKETR